MLQPLTSLTDRTSGAPVLPAELARLYAGDLRFPSPPSGRPYVIGNFVSTVDGIVSYSMPGKSGGAQISGRNEPDLFIMGLLRASADAVMVGSGTLHATAPRHLWTAGYIYPPAAALYDHYRRHVLGKPDPPATIIVSARGDLDLDRPLFQTSGLPVKILTTAHGREKLLAAGAPAELIVPDEHGETIAPAAMLDYLHRRCGVRLLLHEGGPTLFGEFVCARVVDEFFLTLAPQLAGESAAHPRPGILAGTVFLPEAAPWLHLCTLKQSGDHLYLRYTSAPPIE